MVLALYPSIWVCLGIMKCGRGEPEYLALLVLQNYMYYFYLARAVQSAIGISKQYDCND